MTFALHPQLEKDTAFIGDLPLCRVLLMNNRQFPWLILVPRREHLRELFDLEADEYNTMMQEVRWASQRLATHVAAQKMNVAALGNVVPQLHVHVIARFERDVAWPGPVWNNLKAEPYAPITLAETVARIKTALGLT